MASNPAANKITNALSRYKDANPMEVVSLQPMTMPALAPSPKEASVQKAAEEKERVLEWKTTPIVEGMFRDGDGFYLPDGSEVRYGSIKGSNRAIDTYESTYQGLHPDTPEKQARLLDPSVSEDEKADIRGGIKAGLKKLNKQKLALSQELKKPFSEITLDDIKAQGKLGTEANKRLILEGQGENPTLEYATTQDAPGKYGRQLVQVRNPVTGKIVNHELNTSALNASYNTRWNAGARLQDAKKRNVGITSSKGNSGNITDAAVALLGKGSVALGQSLYGAINAVSSIVPGKLGVDTSLDNILREQGLAPDFDRTTQAMDALQSTALKRSKAKVARANKKFADAEPKRRAEYKKDGYAEWEMDVVDFFRSAEDSIKTGIDNPRATMDAAESSAMFLLASIAAGGGAQTLLPKIFPNMSKAAAGEIAALATNVVLEGGSSAEQANSFIMKADPKDLRENSPEFAAMEKEIGTEAARVRLANDKSQWAGLVQGIISGAASNITGAAKFEGTFGLKSAAKKAHQGFVKGSIKKEPKKIIKDTAKKTAGQKLVKSLGKYSGKFVNATGRLAKNPFREFKEEFIQSGSGVIVQNKVKQAADKDQKLAEGAGAQAGAGALSGFISAGVVPFAAPIATVSKEGAKKAKALNQARKEAFSESKKDAAIKSSTNPTEFSNPSEQIRAYSNEHNKPDIEATPKEKAAHKAKILAVLDDGKDKQKTLAAEIAAMPDKTKEDKQAIQLKVKELAAIVEDNYAAKDAYDAYVRQTRQTLSEFDTTIATATNPNTQGEIETNAAREIVLESLDRLSPEQVKVFRTNATNAEKAVIDAFKISKDSQANLANIYETAKSENIPVNTGLKSLLTKSIETANQVISSGNEGNLEKVLAPLEKELVKLHEEISTIIDPNIHAVKAAEFNTALATHTELEARMANKFAPSSAPDIDAMAEQKKTESELAKLKPEMAEINASFDTTTVGRETMRTDNEVVSGKARKPRTAKEGYDEEFDAKVVKLQAQALKNNGQEGVDRVNWDIRDGIITPKNIHKYTSVSPKKPTPTANVSEELSPVVQQDGPTDIDYEAKAEPKTETDNSKRTTPQEVSPVNLKQKEANVSKVKPGINERLEDDKNTLLGIAELALDGKGRDSAYKFLKGGDVTRESIALEYAKYEELLAKERDTGEHPMVYLSALANHFDVFSDLDQAYKDGLYHRNAEVEAAIKYIKSKGKLKEYNLSSNTVANASVTPAIYAANKVAMGNTLSTNEEGNIVATSPEGKTKVMAKGHLLSDWFRGTPISDKTKSPNVLQTTPKFFSNLKQNIAKHLGIQEDTEISEGREDAIASMEKYHDKFVEIFKKVLYQPPVVAEILHDNLDMVHYLGKYELVPNGKNFSYNNVTTYNSKGQKGTAPGIVFDDNILSSIAVASYNFLATQGKATLAADPARVQNILGIGENDTVSQALEDLLGDKGLSISGVIESMGTEAFTYTGLAIKNKDVSVDIKQKMIMSLGTYALMTLMEAGHINTNVVKNSDIIALHPDSPLDADKTSNFVQLNYTTDENGKKIPVTELETLIDTNKASEGLLKDLFNTTSYKTGPTFEKPTDQKEIRTKRGIKNAPDAVKEVINKVSSTPNKVKKSQLYSFLALSDEGKRAANGYETDVDSLHITDRKKAVAINAIIDRTLEDLTDFVGEIQSQDKGMDSEFFYPQELWQSFRQGNAANSMNPVSNKIVRHLLGTANHVVQVESDTARNHFKLAVMEGFGYKVGPKQEKSVEDFDNLLKPGSNVANAQEYQDAIAVIKNNLETQEGYSPEAEATLLKAIDLGGEKTWTLDVLVALATYEADKPFETNIFREVDGITNGTAIQLLMLAGAKDWEAARELLDATGLFSGKYKSYSEWFADVGNFDVYQMSALSFAATLNAFKGSSNSKDVNPEYDRETNQNAFSEAGGNKKTIAAIDSFTKNLYENDTLTKAARDLFKDPTMQSNYGAGISSLMQIMNEELIKNIYDELMENITDNDGVVSVKKKGIKALEKRLTALVGSDIKIDRKNPRDWELTPAQVFNINNKNRAYQGKALEAALRHKLGVMMDRGGELNNAMTVTNVIFKMKYEAAVEAKQKQNQEERGHPVLSENDKTEILATLTKVMPAFKTFFSNKEDLSDEMMLAKEKKQKNYDLGRQTQVQSKSVLKGMGDTASQRSLVSHPSEIGFGDTGAGSTVGGIQSTDSTIMNLLQAEFDILNVWDASGFSITDAEEGSTKFNEHFFNVLKNFSLGIAFQNTLERAVAELSPEERKVIDQYFKDAHKDNQLGHTFTDFNQEGAPRKYTNLEHFVTDYAAKTAAAEKTRHEWLDKITDVYQYNGGFETGYKPPPKVVTKDSYPDAAAENVDLQKQADALTKNILGSQSVSDNPFDFEPETSQSLDKNNVEKTFEELAKLDEDIDSESHIGVLRDVLGNLITKTITPLKVTLETSSKDPVTYGEFEEDVIRLNTASTPIQDSSPISSQEVLVHELVHAVTEQGLNDPKNALIKRRLTKLQKLAEREITPDRLLTVPVDQASDLQKENAKARWEHIFESENSLAEFVAFGKTNQKFMSLLEGISNKRVKISFDGMNFLEKLNELYNQLLDSVFTYITGASNSPNIQKEVSALTDRIAGITGRRETMLSANYPKVDAINETAQRKINEWVLLPMTTWVIDSRDAGILATAKSRVGTVVMFAKHSKLRNTFFGAMDKVMLRMGMTERGIVKSLIQEIRGMKGDIETRYARILSQSNKSVDQTRKEIANTYKTYILKGFKTQVSIEEQKALFFYGKTDFEILVDKYSLDDLLKMHEKNSAKLQEEITNTVEELREFGKKQQGYFKDQALNLAHIMINDNAIYTGGMSNAYNIARVVALEGSVSITWDVDKAKEVIDRLASLYALQITPDSTKKTLAAITKREYTADPEDNGVKSIIATLRDLKKDALDKGFEGQEGLLRKGYMADLLNQDIKTVKATLAEADQLVSEGYTYDETRPLKKDPNDGTKVKQYLFTIKGGIKNSWVKQAVSLTSEKAQGTDLIRVFKQQNDSRPLGAAFREGYRMDRKNLRDSKQHYHKGEKTDYSEGRNENLAEAVVSEEGAIVAYRYRMNSGTKDQLLERDTTISTVLGTMAANITDKVNTKKVNDDVVDITIRDYKDNYMGNEHQFVELSADSDIKAYREIYRLLPDSMKHTIKQVWGEDKIIMRRNMVREVFGYRKVSAADLSFVNKKWMNKVANFERDWQEGARVVKDAIVIKSGGVGADNIVSNTMQTFYEGVNPAKAAKLAMIGTNALTQYMKDKTEVDNLELDLKVRLDMKKEEKAKKQRRVAKLKKDISNNPINPLIQDGQFQTIVEDVNLGHEIEDSTRDTLQERGIRFAKKHLPEGTIAKEGEEDSLLVKAGKTVMMTHSTPIYKGLRNVVMYGDIVARYTVYQDRIDKGHQSKDVLDYTRDLFVNYDLSTHPYIKYLNDVGILWFTAYTLRMLPIYARNIVAFPIRLLALDAVETGIGAEIPNIMHNDINLLHKFGNPIDVAIQSSEIHLVDLVT